MVRAILTATIFSAATVVFAAINGPVTAQDTAPTGPSSVTEIYKDWVVRCNAVVRGEKTVQACAMVQTLRNKSSSKRVLMTSLTSGKDGAVIRFVTPFDLRLSQGLKVKVADELVLEAGFNTCLPAGCIVLGNLPQKSIDTLAAGAAANVVMVANRTGQALELAVSLDGFTAAWNRLKSLEK